MRKLSIAVVFSLVFAVSAQHSFADIWIGGHGDIGVALDAGKLHLHMHLDGPGTRWDPVLGRIANDIPAMEYEAGDHIIAVPNTANVTDQNSSFLNSILGLSVGNTYHRLFSTSQGNAPYVGFASEELDSADIAPATIIGSLNWALLSASGPGNAALWIDDRVMFSSLNATLSESGSNTWTTTIGRHDHFNFGFSAEGTYALEFGVSALVDPDGPGVLGATLLTDSATFTFQTGPFVTAVPEPTSMVLLGSVIGVFALKRFRRRS